MNLDRRTFLLIWLTCVAPIVLLAANWALSQSSDARPIASPEILLVLIVVQLTLLMVLLLPSRNGRSSAEAQSEAAAGSEPTASTATERHDLESCVEEARHAGQTLALLSIECVPSQNIHSLYGAEHYRRVRSELESRIRNAVRLNDVLLSGEQLPATVGSGPGSAMTFFVALKGVQQFENIDAAVQRMLAELRQPIRTSDISVSIEANIGIAVFPDTATDTESLAANSLLALEQVRHRFEQHASYFAAEMRQDSLRRMELERDTRMALESEQFMLYLQPKVLARDGRIVGAEALIRWNHPKHGVLGPGDFLGVIEDTGLMVPLTRWITENVCGIIREIAAQGVEPVPIAINFTGRDMLRSQNVDSFMAAIEGSGLDPRLFEIELTEGTLIGNHQLVIESLERIREKGIRIAVDDFGTGYSSFSYLLQFPIDTIKVDRMFVKDVMEDAVCKAVVRAILTLSEEMGAKVVAEGIETYEQFCRLEEMGAHELQGFFIGRPTTASRFQEMLKADAEMRAAKH